MRSESLESVFRRDLDQLPGLNDDEWVPLAARSGARVTAGGVLAFSAIVLAAIVVGLSVQSVRDTQVREEKAAATADPYFVAAGQGAPAASTASPVRTWLVGPPTSNGLSAVPTCSPGQSPILDISFPPPPGDEPGTGSATAETAFRRTYPSVSEFKTYPFGLGDRAPVWIVAGPDTYVVTYIGGPGQSSWFAHAARFVGCYTPEPRTTPPGGRPSAAPTTFG